MCRGPYTIDPRPLHPPLPHPPHPPTPVPQNGGQTIDLGKPFFAVYQCKKPFKPPGLTGLYAGEVSTLDESQQSAPEGLNTESITSRSLESGSIAIGLPDVNVPRPATTIATGGSVRSVGPASPSLYVRGRRVVCSPALSLPCPLAPPAPPSLPSCPHRHAPPPPRYEQDPVEDGSSMSRYPRMMPPPVRIRTAAGGGGISGTLAGVPRRMKGAAGGNTRSAFSR